MKILTAVFLMGSEDRKISGEAKVKFVITAERYDTPTYFHTKKDTWVGPLRSGEAKEFDSEEAAQEEADRLRSKVPSHTVSVTTR